MTPIRVVDLFAGGGGLSLGFMNAGYEVVAAFDNWDPAINFYKKNITHHPIIKSDLSNNDALQKIASFQPDMIVGGPPCQGFSSAGKRDESLGRATLSINFASIISKILPQWFVMENVERAKNTKSIAEVKKIFKQAGYGLTQVVLDASLCGVPQKRKRIFIVGELNGMDNDLIWLLQSNLSKKSMTLREYFKDKLDIEHYYRHPRSYKRRAVFSIDEPSPTVRGVNRPVPEGYPGHPGDTAPLTKRIRPLTTRERCMIQTFPDNLILEGSKTDLEQIIGNAVPVKLAEYVAVHLKKHIESSVSTSAIAL